MKNILFGDNGRSIHIEQSVTLFPNCVTYWTISVCVHGTAKVLHSYDMVKYYFALVYISSKRLSAFSVIEFATLQLSSALLSETVVVQT